MTERTAPAKCIACGANRVAWTKPRVDFCYPCLPGGPLTPPPCSRCGSARYYNNGLCVACHPHGPEHIESCLGCLAWGVSRTYRSRCWTCRWWRTHYVEGDCTGCGRRTVISERRICRLCWETARRHQAPGRAVDLADATRFGQQLFFANTQSSRQAPRTRAARPHRRPRLPNLVDIPHGQRFAPVPWTQLALLEFEVDADVIAGGAGSPESELVRYCDEIIRDHAEAHGWSRKHTNDVRRTLRLVQLLQHTPNAKINATDVLKLPSLRGNVSALSTLDVLAAAGVLNDDRLSPIERYFTDQIDGLPEAMTAQLRVWFDVMVNGSTGAPRRRPRHPDTARLHIRALAPIARVWAAQGHDSLAAIERADIIAALPAPGARRHATDQGLRSLFGVLKGRKLVFIDPTRGVAYNGTNATVPLPLDAKAIRAALDSPDPAAALAVALVAFHALASREVRGDQAHRHRRWTPHHRRASDPSRCAGPAAPGRVARPSGPDMARHHEPAPVHQPPHRATADRGQPTLSLEAGQPRTPNAARRPDPRRDPRHRRGHPSRLRAVRPQRRSRYALRLHARPRHRWRVPQQPRLELPRR